MFKLTGVVAILGAGVCAMALPGCGGGVEVAGDLDSSIEEDAGKGGGDGGSDRDSGKIGDTGAGGGDNGATSDGGADAGADDDSGAGTDSGTGDDVPAAADAGGDSGVSDSGTDSGVVTDAGQDAGNTDAGSADAGADAGSGGPHPNGWSSPSVHGAEAKQGIAACAACHGADLEGGAGPSCNTCHPGFKTNCTFCHGGSDNQTGAPPADTTGKTATSEVTVGAHTSHAEAKGNISAPFDCVMCHVKPADALSAGHIDGAPAEVDPSDNLSGAVAWDRVSHKCTNAYCHGNFTGGVATNVPVWTTVNGSQAACGTCHALPPKTGRHPTNFAKHSFMLKDCTNCHNGIANNTATGITDPTLHVNGAKDVKLKSNGTWNSTTKTCDPACHGSEKW